MLSLLQFLESASESIPLSCHSIDPGSLGHQELVLSFMLKWQDSKSDKFGSVYSNTMGCQIILYYLEVIKISMNQQGNQQVPPLKLRTDAKFAQIEAGKFISQDMSLSDLEKFSEGFSTYYPQRKVYCDRLKKLIIYKKFKNPTTGNKPISHNTKHHIGAKKRQRPKFLAWFELSWVRQKIQAKFKPQSKIVDSKSYQMLPSQEQSACVKLSQQKHRLCDMISNYLKILSVSLNNSIMTIQTQQQNQQNAFKNSMFKRGQKAIGFKE